ncbi:hypothetical protein V1L52_05905 [Treponema sp. HNW]|uniref:hypothetical protein n=1 Tax=Treponema sp. HNW TaxID=3116654 RepID=UPI003D144E7A
MHKKKRLTYILYGLCVVLLCTAVAGSIARKNGKNLKETKTALLNPKYAYEVNSVRIRPENAQKELVLRKMRFGWTGESADVQGRKILFPADNRHIDSLIETARKIRSMYIISDSNALKGPKSPFFASNDAFFDFSFLRDERLFSRFYVKSAAFRAGNRAFSRLYIRPVINERPAAVYAAQSDLSAFLSVQPAAWADGKLFSDYARGGKTADDVQKIVYSFYGKGGALSDRKTFAAGDKDFERAVHNLFSARTSRIGVKPDTAFGDSFEKSCEIVCTFSNGEDARLLIYPSGDDFIAVPSVLDYALYISAWTASSIGIIRGPLAELWEGPLSEL